LFTAIFYAVYGINVLLNLKKNGLNAGIKLFNSQILEKNQIKLTSDILLKANQVFGYIFATSAFLISSKVFKKSILLLAFLILEWTAVMQIWGDLQKAVHAGNLQLTNFSPALWDKYGAFLLSLGTILL
jgi:hypothetical protein